VLASARRTRWSNPAGKPFDNPTPGVMKWSPGIANVIPEKSSGGQFAGTIIVASALAP
jgi:hypothetical protein